MSEIYIIDIDNFSFRIMNKTEDSENRIIVNIHSSESTNKELLYDNDIINKKVNKFSVYLSRSNLGCFRLLYKPVQTYYKGTEDYIQQTFIHLKLNDYINKCIQILSNVNNNLIYLNDEIENHIDDDNRTIKKNPFLENNEYKCGFDNKQDDKDTIIYRLTKFSDKLTELYNYSENNFVCHYTVNNELDNYKIEFYKINLNLKIPKDDLLDNIILYYCNIDITRFNKQEINYYQTDRKNFKLPVFLTTNDQITKFGTFTNYILAGNYICKLFEYTNQCNSDDIKCKPSIYQLIGDRYDNIFPFTGGQLNEKYKIISSDNLTRFQLVKIPEPEPQLPLIDKDIDKFSIKKDDKFLIFDINEDEINKIKDKITYCNSITKEDLKDFKDFKKKYKMFNQKRLNTEVKINEIIIEKKLFKEKLNLKLIKDAFIIKILNISENSFDIEVNNLNDKLNKVKLLTNIELLTNKIKKNNKDCFQINFKIEESFENLNNIYKLYRDSFEQIRNNYNKQMIKKKQKLIKQLNNIKQNTKLSQTYTIKKQLNKSKTYLNIEKILVGNEKLLKFIKETIKQKINLGSMIFKLYDNIEDENYRFGEYINKYTEYSNTKAYVLLSLVLSYIDIKDYEAKN